jgi:SAM-dependent methyltransferase
VVAPQASDDSAYLTSCFPDRLELPHAEAEQERALLDRIESKFNVLLLPWLLTCGVPIKDRVFLEIGCGDGKYGHFIAQHTSKYIGVDIRDVSLDRARALLGSSEKCEVVRGNGRYLDGIADSSCTLIFSYQTFIHMPDGDVVRSNIVDIIRVLAPGGQARIQLLGPSVRKGWRLSWRKLGRVDMNLRSCGIGRRVMNAGLNWLRRVVPGDVLLPVPTRSDPYNEWGHFGAWLHPDDAIRLARAHGVHAFITPSTYGSPYDGHDFAIYWLILVKGDSGLPYFLTLA